MMMPQFEIVNIPHLIQCEYCDIGFMLIHVLDYTCMCMVIAKTYRAYDLAFKIL